MAVLIFFISFYRITIVSSSFYLSLFFSLSAIAALLINSEIRNQFKTAIGYKLLFSSIAMFLWVFCIDIFSGIIVISPNAAFSVRIISLFLLSVFPAFFINCFFIKGDERKFIYVISGGFLIQTIFWFLTFVYPDVKVMLYSFIGSPNSVNLRDYNIGSRGFGLSNEINFTTPFMMVFIVMTYYRNLLFKGIILVTQLFNSNLVLLALLIGLVNGKTSFLNKVIILTLSVLSLFFVLAAYVPRLGAELDGLGMQTIGALLGDHVFFLGDFLSDYIFGPFRYVFHGQDIYRSDIGWVIMANIGGGVLLFLFLIFITILIVRVSTSLFSVVILLSIVVILNTKGLLLGPNAFMFTMFFILFHNYYSRMRNV
ncbi:hypothetical protein HKB31_18605 [Vibrio alginolyticus]|nr:hypothetical protein [Vibrio alginolyticus]